MQLNQMKPKRKSLTRLPAWKSLAQQSKELRKVHLRQLFADDPTRGETFTAEAAGRCVAVSAGYDRVKIADIGTATVGPRYGCLPATSS